MTNENRKITPTDEALARLLDKSPGAPPSPRLKAQILQAALASEASDTNMPDANIIAFAPRRKAVSGWLVGGALAASLVIGIWAGATGIASTLVSAPLELAGFQTDIPADETASYDMTYGLTPGDYL